MGCPQKSVAPPPSTVQAKAVTFRHRSPGRWRAGSSLSALYPFAKEPPDACFKKRGQGCPRSESTLLARTLALPLRLRLGGARGQLDFQRLLDFQLLAI